MINQLLLALILTILPISELRLGMPIAVNYALKTNIPIITVILLIILLNCLIVLFVFFFLDKLHKIFMNFKFYRRLYDHFIKRLRKKVDKFEKNYAVYGFLALILFVAIPIPGSGAWTGCIISWLIGLDRKKSIASIMLGVILAGIFVALASLGIISFLL